MSWQVWRQDDNGNKFVIGIYPTREVAEVKVADLTRSHHKQTYWVSEVENGCMVDDRNIAPVDKVDGQL